MNACVVFGVLTGIGLIVLMGYFSMTWRQLDRIEAKLDGIHGDSH